MRQMELKSDGRGAPGSPRKSLLPINNMVRTGRRGKRDALLEAHRQVIGPYDILLAAQALARSLVLVKANTREFSRVPGLTLENWVI